LGADNRYICHGYTSPPAGAGHKPPFDRTRRLGFTEAGAQGAEAAARMARADDSVKSICRDRRAFPRRRPRARL